MFEMLSAPGPDHDCTQKKITVICIAYGNFI